MNPTKLSFLLRPRSLFASSFSSQSHYRSIPRRTFATSSEVDVVGKTRIINQAQKSIQVLRETADKVQRRRLLEIDNEFESRPDIWERDIRTAKALAREQRILKERLDNLKELEQSFQSNLELCELAEEENDVQITNEAIRELTDTATRARKSELDSLLCGPADHMGCYFEISVGSGGTEAMDFAGQLLNMYESWASLQGFNLQIKEKQDGPEVGIRSAVVMIDTEYSYGWMRGEQGSHRICRISPYDAAARRHTSFAQVAVFPMETNDDDSEIELKESDLRIDTFRSSGPGGQSVNTTSSAVRITHIPTGVSAASQNERSQHRNKATAMSVLKAKLLAMQLKAKAEAEAKVRSSLGEASFGSQIRTYYWNPQKFVKDHRSGHEDQDAAGVLEGHKLQPFMEAYLQWETSRGRVE
jgi:peptide chain release factor 2